MKAVTAVCVCSMMVAVVYINVVVVVDSLIMRQRGCVGPALPGADIRGGRDRDIQDLSGVLECSGIGAVP